MALDAATLSSFADGSVVTFMAVHSLPAAKAMKGTSVSYSNSGGWEEPDMRTDTMKSYVLANLDDSFKSALKAVRKPAVVSNKPLSAQRSMVGRHAVARLIGTCR